MTGHFRQDVPGKHKGRPQSTGRARLCKLSGKGLRLKTVP